MDDPTQPTVAPTGEPGAASLPPMIPASPAPTTSPVNPAQAPQLTSPNTNNTPVDVSAMIAQYESRIRNLMSEKDKALNERNIAINAQVEMQRQLTEYQTQASTTLATTTDAAQSAINEATALRARVAALEAQLARANVVLARPELADYIQFIPAESDPEKLNQAVEQLAGIRQRDLERAGVRTFPTMPTPTVPGTPPALAPAAGQPPAAGQQPQQANPYALYGQRQNMAPVTQIGSSPAMMNPAGSGDTLASINTILQEAMQSGDPAKFAAALEQTKVLANQDINRQLGRS